MPLRKSAGNMYPWVTHTHTHIGGECPHKCTYCYVKNNRFGRPAKYQGPIRLLEDELDVNYGKGNIIFVDNCNDLFASLVPDEWIRKVLIHCHKYPHNKYVFQTKNPERYLGFQEMFPEGSLLGCTIETNRLTTNDISSAPIPFERMLAMSKLGGSRRFVTIEPILDFDVDTMAEWMELISPEFINIGADSQRHELNEPKEWKVRQLISLLRKMPGEIRIKTNLERLIIPM